MSAAVVGCACGCTTHWRREPGWAARLVDDPDCIRHVQSFGELYRQRVYERQRRAEGRAA